MVDKKRDGRVLKMVRAGKSYEEISKTEGISTVTVWSIKKRHGLVGVSIYRRKGIDATEVLALLRQGHSQKAIAEKVGCSVQNINNIVRRKGTERTMNKKEKVTMSLSPMAEKVVALNPEEIFEDVVPTAVFVSCQRCGGPLTVRKSQELRCCEGCRQ